MVFSFFKIESMKVNHSYIEHLLFHKHSASPKDINVYKNAPASTFIEFLLLEDIQSKQLLKSLIRKSLTTDCISIFLEF